SYRTPRDRMVVCLDEGPRLGGTAQGLCGRKPILEEAGRAALVVPHSPIAAAAGPAVLTTTPAPPPLSNSKRPSCPLPVPARWPVERSKPDGSGTPRRPGQHTQGRCHHRAGGKR